MSQDQNVWAKSMALIWGPHVAEQIMFSSQIKYNCLLWINSVVTEKEMKLCASQGVVYGHQVITSHSGPSLTSQH